MTNREFMEEMEILEACKKASREQRSNKVARWKGVFRIVAGYSAEVFKEACTRLMSGGDGYIPSSDEIAETCEEVYEEKNVQKPLKSQYSVATHTCAADRSIRNYTAQLIATLMGYEGEHLYCLGEIPATCPACGRRHFQKGIFKQFFEFNKESMEGVNDCLKGYSICAECTKAGVKGASVNG